MNNISNALKSLSVQDRRVIEKEFEKLNSDIKALQNAKITLSQDILDQIRDVAKREAHYFGAQSVGTWKIKDTVRIPQDEVRKAIDVVIYKGGNLVVRGDLVIGN